MRRASVYTANKNNTTLKAASASRSPSMSRSAKNTASVWLPLMIFCPDEANMPACPPYIPPWLIQTVAPRWVPTRASRTPSPSRSARRDLPSITTRFLSRLPARRADFLYCWLSTHDCTLRRRGVQLTCLHCQVKVVESDLWK
jgi:hypothetical protein